MVTGNLYNTTRRKAHPSHVVVFDDIYFGYLVMRAFANRRLTLVHAHLSEVDKSKPVGERLDPQNGTVRIYHKLKTQLRFGWINNTRTLDALRQNVRGTFDCFRVRGLHKVRGLHLTSTSAAGELGVTSHANLTECCERWTFCDPPR